MSPIRVISDILCLFAVNFITLFTPSNVTTIMEDFKAISEGIKSWNKIARSLKLANRILQTSVEFLISEELPLDSSLTGVNVYFGYRDNALFAVLIQASKDLSERYRNDLEGVMKDMVVIDATGRLLTATTEIEAISAGSGTQIETVRALKRIARWEDERLRMKVMKSVSTAPLIFEVPKENFKVQGQKRLLFGLRIAKKCCCFKKLEYDLLLKAETDSNLRIGQAFYDVALAIPPHRPSFSKGLYNYLELSV